MAAERGVEGDLFQQDMGQGVGFRAGTFDGTPYACTHSLTHTLLGVISVSALQWILNADKSWHDPRKRLRCFFTKLYSAMVRMYDHLCPAED